LNSKANPYHPNVVRRCVTLARIVMKQSLASVRVSFLCRNKLLTSPIYNCFFLTGYAPDKQCNKSEQKNKTKQHINVEWSF